MAGRVRVAEGVVDATSAGKELGAYAREVLGVSSRQCRKRSAPRGWCEWAPCTAKLSCAREMWCRYCSLPRSRLRFLAEPQNLRVLYEDPGC